ncbi:MAG TPA: glycosyltransferase family 2 protein [Syntrophorhabdaceae bacterium]|nr:glycosyltransferase family 2 protein [Syntrophorhabdaceae bacterium]
MKLSVIIPTRNRDKYLEKAIQSISEQTLPQDLFEVIVVDNGSKDNTKKVAESFVGKIKNLIYIYYETPGLHVGRHSGLLAAKSDILVYGDDDIIATTTWLEGILESFEDERVALVGGKNIPLFEVPPPKWILDIWNKGGKYKTISYLSILDFGNEILTIDPYYVYGCNFSIRKSILLETGGFHPDGMPKELIKYRGDGETYVARYIKEKGYKAMYNPKASVYHLCSAERLTKEYFARRAFNQGISDSYSDVREGKRRSLLRMKLNVVFKKYLAFKGCIIEESYLQGYKFHQEELRKDSNLIDWVKRKNYIDDGNIR